MTIFALRSVLPFERKTALFFGALLLAFVLTSNASGQIQGFTEPFRTIDLSSDESGAISALLVEEGQHISKNEIVANLDNRVQKLQLEIATQMANSTSQLTAAQHTYTKRKAISDRLEQLESRGHASQSEIIRAQMELSIAHAKWLAAKEDQAVKEIEQRRAEVQLERRNIRAPFDGIVSKIHRRDGEFLSPLRPEIVTIVQTDRLLATFAIQSSQINEFAVGREFTLEIAGGQSVPAKVYSVGVETDAQSGTVLVKLVIENPTQKIRAGESCMLNI